MENKSRGCLSAAVTLPFLIIAFGFFIMSLATAPFDGQARGGDFWIWIGCAFLFAVLAFVVGSMTSGD